jgi:hypothetical protein
MQRDLIFVIAVVAAGWARVTVAQSSPSHVMGEPWLFEGRAAQSPSDVADRRLDGLSSPTKDPATTTLTRAAFGGNWVRFGSGLSDDDPVRSPDVFQQSGLEGLTAVGGTHLSAGVGRFGSGLEEDAPVGFPDVFLQSGLEGLTAVRAAQSSAKVARFGSGLEDEAPARSPSVLHQSGL